MLGDELQSLITEGMIEGIWNTNRRLPNTIA